MNKIKMLIITSFLFTPQTIAFAEEEGQQNLAGFNESMTNLLSTPQEFKKGYYALVGLFIFLGVTVSIIKYLAASDDHESVQAKKMFKKYIAITFGIPIFISLVLSIIQWRLGVSIIF